MDTEKMTVGRLAEKLELELLAGGRGIKNEIKGGYTGDLLSWVMGRAKSGDALITVMGNVNAVAVAVLAELSCIVLAENAALDDEARQKAEQQGVPVLRSEKNAYTLCLFLHKALL